MIGSVFNVEDPDLFVVRTCCNLYLREGARIGKVQISLLML